MSEFVHRLISPALVSMNRDSADHGCAEPRRAVARYEGRREILASRDRNRHDICVGSDTAAFARTLRGVGPGSCDVSWSGERDGDRHAAC
jgi:hypothetical protein